MVNHRVDNRVDPCWNQCCKTSNHWRSVNEKSFTIMLSDLKSATIIRACIRLATITNISCITYLIWNFSPLLGILIMWEMVLKMVNHRVDNRVDPCWNQCCKTSIYWRSVNKKSFTMLSDLKSATIIRACIRSATIKNISCITYLIWNFSSLLGILIMWEMV